MLGHKKKENFLCGKVMAGGKIRWYNVAMLKRAKAPRDRRFCSFYDYIKRSEYYDERRGSKKT